MSRHCPISPDLLFSSTVECGDMLMDMKDRPSERHPDNQPDSSFIYRGKPEVNSLYIQGVPHAINSEKPSSLAAEASLKSLIGTSLFLLALLVAGYFAGYMMKSNAPSRSGQSPVAALSLSAITPAAGLDMASKDSKLIAAIGSPASEELIALDASGNQTSALIRIHDTSGMGPDAFSIMAFEQDGSVHEVLRRSDPDLKSMAMARAVNGNYVTASLQSNMMSVHGYKADGKEAWSRQFNIASQHDSAINIAATPQGMIIVGPAETAGSISIVSLANDGALIWQRSLAVDPKLAASLLATDNSGSSFIVLSEDDAASAEHYRLMYISAGGQTIWQTMIALDDGDSPVNLVANGEHGVYLLTTGNTTYLSRYSVQGEMEWQVPLPQARLFSNIELIATQDGDAVVAVSYAIAGDRLDVWFEQRNTAGELIAETNTSLPNSSEVNAIAHPSQGRYLLAGSLRPSRFENTDIFVKDLNFSPDPDAAPLENVAVILDTKPAPDTLQPAGREVNAIEPIETPSKPELTDSVPVLEALPAGTSKQAEETSLTQPQAVAAVKPTTPVENSEQVEQAASQLPVSRLLTGSELPANELINTENMVRAQCRFACADEKNTSEIFHMWRAVSGPQADFPAILAEQNILACRVAAGIVPETPQVDCQPG